MTRFPQRLDYRPGTAFVGHEVHALGFAREWLVIRKQDHFLVRDEKPLLFHAGLKGMFPALREAVTKIIDPAKLRHIAWSHFESDEIGALNDCGRRK